MGWKACRRLYIEEQTSIDLYKCAEFKSAKKRKESILIKRHDMKQGMSQKCKRCERRKEDGLL